MATSFGSIGSNLIQAGNRLTKGGASAWSNGNAYSSIPIRAGDKIYWEIKVSGSIHVMTGFVCTDSSPEGETYQDSFAVAQSNAYAFYYNNGSNQLIVYGESASKSTLVGSGFSLTDTDILGCTFDYDNQSMEVFKNNVSQGSVDLNDDYLEAAWSVDIYLVLSLFNDGSWAEIYTDAADQTYAPPAGFTALENSVPADYAEQVNALGPIAYWRLGEASGTVADDETVNDYDGTYVDSPTLGESSLQPSDFDTSVTFNANDMMVAEHAFGSVKTVAFIVKPVTLTTENTIISLTTNAGNPEFDITNSLLDKSKDITAITDVPLDILFNGDGSKLYVLILGTLYEYTLSTPWDISTATQTDLTNVPNSFDKTFFFNGDGTILWTFASAYNQFSRNDLSTAWDISTAAYVSNFVNASDFEGSSAMYKSLDGSKLYVGISTSIKVFDLSTSHDITTRSLDTTYTLAEMAGLINSISFSPDGFSLIVANDYDDIYQYRISVAWDISTRTYEGTRLSTMPYVPGISLTANGSLITAENDEFLREYISPQSGNTTVKAYIDDTNSNHLTLSDGTTTVDSGVALNPGGTYHVVITSDTYVPPSGTTWGDVGSALTQVGNRITRDGTTAWANGNGYIDKPIVAGDKVYWEVKTNDSIYFMTGVGVDAPTYQASYAPAQNDTWAGFNDRVSTDLLLWNAGAQRSNINASFILTSSDVLGVTFDYDAMQLAYYKNNVAVGTVDLDDTFGETPFAANAYVHASLYDPNSYVEVYTKAADQTYDPPSGFTSLEPVEATGGTKIYVNGALALDSVEELFNDLTVTKVGVHTYGSGS